MRLEFKNNFKNNLSQVNRFPLHEARTILSLFVILE